LLLCKKYSLPAGKGRAKAGQRQARNVKFIFILLHHTFIITLGIFADSPLKENPNATTSQMAKIIGVTRRTIARDIEELKAKGLLKRIGSDKTSHWQITNS